MTPRDDHRERVRQAVREEMSQRGWNVADLAREAAVDPGTVGDFLSGPRWPQMATRSKIARALGWTPESIGLIERGRPPVLEAETVVPGDQDAQLLASLPPEALEGLGAAERAEVLAAMKLSALEKAREVRRRLDQ